MWQLVRASARCATVFQVPRARPRAAAGRRGLAHGFRGAFGFRNGRGSGGTPAAVHALPDAADPGGGAGDAPRRGFRATPPGAPGVHAGRPNKRVNLRKYDSSSSMIVHALYPRSPAVPPLPSVPFVYPLRPIELIHSHHELTFRGYRGYRGYRGVHHATRWEPRDPLLPCTLYPSGPPFQGTEGTGYRGSREGSRGSRGSKGVQGGSRGGSRGSRGSS